MWSYNPYGQAKTESVYIGTFAEYGNMQSWDAAGRRKALGFGLHGTSFGWRADGALLSASDPSGGGFYTYDTAGQLLTRTVGSRVTTLAQRDGAGRLLTISNNIAGTSRLTETLTWTGDGLPATDIMARSDFTDSRAYFYASQSRRLIEERLNIDATKRWTNTFTYDGGNPSGAGVLTKAGIWSGATNALLRVISETNLARIISASGTNNGAATVSAYLDGQPVPITQIGTQKLEWRATLELTPGAHQLRAEALHPFGLFTAYATNWFTNVGPAEVVHDMHDGSGRVTSRVWKTGSTTNRTQTLTRDGKGRLLKTVERDSTQSGFDEIAVHDPLDRRIRLTKIPFTNGVAISNSIVTLNQVYDPAVEFLELGVSKNGETAWKLYGPDLNGVYGGLNGVGGFEAIIPAAELFCPVISDSLGNLHGLYDQNHATFEWFSTRVTAQGAVPGYRPLPLSEGAPSIAHASAFRGKWGDANGTIKVGVRELRWDVGLFLSPDPRGHDGNENLEGAFNGVATVYWDADGKLATTALRYGTGIDLDSSLSFGDQLLEYRRGGQEWMGPVVSTGARLLDTTWNLAALTAFSADPRLNSTVLNTVGSPLSGLYNSSPWVQQLPSELSTPAQDLLFSFGGAARSPGGVNVQARTPADPRLLPGEGRVGTFTQLTGQIGDNLTPHHIPAAAYMRAHGVSRGDGISMLMEQPNPGTGGRHRMTASYGTQPNFSFTPRQTLARDIRDVRGIYMQQGLYSPGIRESLQQVIQQNINTYPHLFGRNAPVLNLPQSGGTQ